MVLKIIRSWSKVDFLECRKGFKNARKVLKMLERF